MINISRFNNMNRLIVISLCVLGSLQLCAQDRHFDPAKFQADLEQYIVTQAALTPQESAAFFPLYREMCNKQRMLFDQMRRYHHIDTSDNRACLEAIRIMDQNDILIKKLQQNYHAKFLKILPAGKVLMIIKAESKFHRMAFKRMAKQGNNQDN